MIEYATLAGVTLHDLSLNGDIYVEKVEGLSGFPVIRGTTYDRPMLDGAVEPAQQFLGARTSAWNVAVFGTNVEASRVNWSTLMRTLNAAVRSQQQLRWRYLGSSLGLQSDVRITSMTPPVIDNQQGAFRFQVMFRHADPNNYDQVLQSQTTFAPTVILSGLPLPIPFPIPWSSVPSGAGNVTLTNSGDSYAWPIIDIVGPITNPVIQNQNTGLSLNFTSLTVNAGDTLHIDTHPGNRVATVSGISKFAALDFTSSDWFSVSPGATESISISGSSTDPAVTTMTVTLRSAYLT